MQGSSFWFAESDTKKMLPFLTLVTTDAHDSASDLTRPGVYRLNLPLAADAYRERFGLPAGLGADGLGLRA